MSSEGGEEGSLWKGRVSQRNPVGHNTGDFSGRDSNFTPNSRRVPFPKGHAFPYWYEGEKPREVVGGREVADSVLTFTPAATAALRATGD